MPIMIVAFLSYIVCLDATIESHVQCLNLHKKYESSEVLHNSSTYSNILEQIQDTF